MIEPVTKVFDDIQLVVEMKISSAKPGSGQPKVPMENVFMSSGLVILNSERKLLFPKSIPCRQF